MARAPEPPTATEIVQMLGDLRQNVYADQDAQIDKLRSTREFKDKVDLPARWYDTDFLDATVADEIGRVSETLSLTSPACRVSRDPDASDEKIRNATQREHWSEGIFDVCGRGQDGTDTNERVVDSCVGDGGAWPKLLFTRDTWEGRYAIKRAKLPDDAPQDQIDAATREYDRSTEEAKKDAGPPFSWLYADARNVYPTFSGRDIGSVIEVSERPLYATLRKYGLGIEGNQIVPGSIGQPGPPGQNPSKVEFIEYWTKDHCIYVINGDGMQPYAVPAYKHGYGRVPYFPAYGFMMGHWANRKVGWGIAQTKLWLVQYMSFLRTLHAQVAIRDAMTPVLEMLAENDRPNATVPDRPDAKKKGREFPIGQIIQVPYGRQFAPFPITQTSQALKEQIAMTAEQIEKMLTPRVTSQIAGSGLEGAGYAMHQVLEEVRIHFRPYVKHIERSLEEATYFAWELVRSKVRERVWVYIAPASPGDSRKTPAGYIGLAPDDLKDAVKVSWTVDPEGPAAKLIESRYYAEQVAAHFMGRDQAIEEQGRNSDEVRDAITADEVRDSPEYKAWKKQDILQHVGFGQIMQLTQQAMAVAKDGVLPGGQQLSPQVPDQGKLAATPNQQQPDMGPNAESVPTNGNLGGSNVPVPTQSAAPQVPPG